MSLVAFTHSSRLIEPDVERRPVIDFHPKITSWTYM